MAGKIWPLYGTWVSDKDPNWKMTFTKRGICEWIYDVEPDVEEYDFTVGNQSPWCGYDVPVHNNTSYLRLIHRTNGDEFCYEINVITETKLSLRSLGMGGHILFNRSELHSD